MRIVVLSKEMSQNSNDGDFTKMSGILERAHPEEVSKDGGFEDA